MARRTDPRRDLIAQEAARLVLEEQVHSIEKAIRQAAEHLGWPDVARPARRQVHDHIQGMRLETLGEAGCRRQLASLWAAAEQIMTVFEDDRPSLVGRAAEGRIDGEVSLRIRLYSDSRVSELADRLLQWGYENELSFDTAHTRLGRFDRINLIEDGIPITLTRCPITRFHEVHAVNLHTGEPITVVDLISLRRAIAQLSGADDSEAD